MLRQALTGMQCARHRLLMHCLSLEWGLADGDIGKIASGPCKVNTFSSLVLNMFMGVGGGGYFRNIQKGES